jgi:hypothetical protein
MQGPKATEMKSNRSRATAGKRKSKASTRSSSGIRCRDHDGEVGLRTSG